MSNIVERLRLPANVNSRSICREAANEIERLRAAASQIGEALMAMTPYAAQPKMRSMIDGCIAGDDLRDARRLEREEG